MEYREILLNQLTPELKERVELLFNNNRSRKPFYLKERGRVIQELRELYKFSYPEIGLLLGISHSAVIWRYKKLLTRGY